MLKIFSGNTGKLRTSGWLAGLLFLSVLSFHAHAATTVPVCILTAEPASVVPGGSSTLTAICSPAATAYTWTGDPCAGTAGATCIVTPSPTSTYSVTGSNAIGVGNTAYGSVWVGTLPTPICVLTAEPASIAPGRSSTLTANCFAATSYTWTGGTCAGTTGATCIVTPSATTTYSVTGSNASSNGNTASGSVTVATAPAYQGLWWNQSEPGWGMSITQHSSMLFAALYTYDQTGQPEWYVMSNCPVSVNSCRGSIFKFSGGTSPAVPWNSADKVVSNAGTGTLTFTDADNGTFDYILNGISGSKSITRQVFATGTTPPAVDYTDLWWNPNEPGWGVALTQEYGMIFAAWYTYDATGKAIWYVVSSCPVVGSGCTGDVYQVTGGSPLTSIWKGFGKTVTKAGSLTFVFTDANNGSMSYSINGVSGDRTITRQGF